MYQVRHVHAGVGEQFVFACKHSLAHKSVQKANKKHPAVAYGNKIDAFVNYTAFQHWLLAWVFSLPTEQDSINSHLFLSILGFAICHHTCISIFMLRQLVGGREEEDFMEEVSAQMLWKCSRDGLPDSRQEHKATAAAARQETRVHVRLQDRIRRLKSASPYLAYLFTVNKKRIAE